MQSPKGRAGTLVVPLRTSHVKPRTARQLKTSGSDSEFPIFLPASRTPKYRSPKVNERKSLGSPVSEGKRSRKISELESRLAQTQEDLKKCKDQLLYSESCKRNAEQETKEVKKQLIALAWKHGELQHQLLELSGSEEERIQELRKISQDRDKEWEYELGVVQKQHSVESAVLASALNEIQRLKTGFNVVVDSEAVQTKDVEILRLDLAKTLSVIEVLKTELNKSKESEAHTQAMIGDTLRQLEAARIAMERLRLDGIKTMEAYNSLSLELEQSRSHITELEGLANKLQRDLPIASYNHSGDRPLVKTQSPEIREEGNLEQNSVELNSMKLEVVNLRSSLETLEIKYQEEQIESTMKIGKAYELVEQVKSNTCIREAELESELKWTRAHLEELKSNLIDKETELQSISGENKRLSMELNKALSTQRQPELDMEVNKLKSSMTDDETSLHVFFTENEMLKSEIQTRETKRKMNDEAFGETEAVGTGVRDPLVKLGYLTEEAGKCSTRAEHAIEQLEAVQVVKTEMEAELRRLKVQSDQWRKAAEAAVAILSSGNTKKCIDRSGSLDRNNRSLMGKMFSPYSEDLDDDPLKKKNMLKKFSGLLKKSQK